MLSNCVFFHLSLSFLSLATNTMVGIKQVKKLFWKKEFNIETKYIFYETQEYRPI